ncbi:hypothetical protein [Curtobacterium caseinilyticum]|uniref:Transcription factor zinc-finger domain-containing protein n=1 Tax=Curtobacterium caseinilyticum TaxID=3055137 RepID=A0ABT7TLP3_9MICO|nr:hypothetical protein [Curtobacterium caseinilyticum]MDM7890446.1 hypothetical protein [Curtobacterium caseinilyticum]
MDHALEGGRHAAGLPAMSVAGCLMVGIDTTTARRRTTDDEERVMMHDGWCPDCDLRTVVIDLDEQSGNAWADCTECGAGWVHRDELPEPASAQAAPSERQAA